MQSMGIEVQLFDYLERHAPSQEQHERYDIADYLLQIKTKESVLSELIQRNPAFKLLVEKLELRVVEETRQTKPPLRKRGLRRYMEVEASLCFGLPKTSPTPIYQGETIPMVSSIRQKKQ